MKVITDRENRELYFKEQPEVRLRVIELQTPKGACAAWERLRNEGIGDEDIKSLFLQTKFTEQTLNNEARHNVVSSATANMKHLGTGATSAIIDTVTREADRPSPSVSKIIGQMVADGLSATEIGNQFVARFREA